MVRELYTGVFIFNRIKKPRGKMSSITAANFFFSSSVSFTHMMLWFSVGFSFIFLFYNGLSFLLQHIFYVAAAHRAEEWR